MEAWRNRIVGTGEENPEQLLANPSNWRIHPKHQQDALAAVLNEVGWVQNVIVNQRTGHVVDGHLRVSLALRREEKSVPVVYVNLLESEESLILATIDPLSALAATDKEKLDSLLHEVETGSPELQKMLAELAIDNGLTYGATGEEVDAEPQIDRAAELQEKWKTERGQVWQLGEHRLMCGDSTDKTHVVALLGDCRPFLMVTDPPYGVDYEGGVANATKRERLVGDSTTELFGPALMVAAGVMPIGAWYVWHAGRRAGPVYSAIESAGFEVRALIIWNKLKAHYGAPSAHYCRKHEPCLYAVRDNAKWSGPSNETTVWDIEQPQLNEWHPTQKPVECMARPIRNHGGKDDDVYDPFVGSGTTIIAAEQLNRRCFAMEIEPKYVAVCLQRFVDATGKEVKCLTGATVS